MLVNVDSDSTKRRLYGIDSRCMVLDAANPTQVNHAAAIGFDAGTIETARADQELSFTRA
jgi:hypothetical protein